jgi:hypothetical protein
MSLDRPRARVDLVQVDPVAMKALQCSPFAARPVFSQVSRHQPSNVACGCMLPRTERRGSICRDCMQKPLKVR